MCFTHWIIVFLLSSTVWHIGLITNIGKMNEYICKVVIIILSVSHVYKE